jgi:two-component system cell cycle sensor histidine kinase/response regulator CckA
MDQDGERTRAQLIAELEELRRRLSVLESDGVTAVVQDARDITDQTRVEEERSRLATQILQARKLESLGVLAGGIAHDFNNLLMGVLGNAELALEDLSPASPIHKHVDRIRRAALRAAELAGQLLSYSGKGRFVVETVQLSALVAGMSHLLSSSVADGAALRYHFAEEIPAIEADVAQMRQVALNLITNASQALGAETGTIDVSTGVMTCSRSYLTGIQLGEERGEGEYVFLEVSDTGCGMDRERVAQLFDPFLTAKSTGRGLGLAAVLGIVHGHRGAIEVDSRPGEGTRIKVLFPALSAHEVTAPVPAVATPQPAAGGTILLVDDQTTVVQVGKRMLERTGFEVFTATGGREALDIFRRHSDEIDCVLLDLTMPDLGGEETFEALHRIRADVPVILASGYDQDEVERRFAGKGFAGFIHKPYGLKKLTAKIRGVLGLD